MITSALAFLTGAQHGADGVRSCVLQAIDHALNLAGALLRAAGQRPYLVSHHRESTPRLAGTGCLDGGIERQQIGLLGNGTNHVEHADDAFHVLLQSLQRLAAAAQLAHQFMNLVNALVYDLLGRKALLIGFARGLGGTLGAHRHFVGSGRHLVDCRGHLVGFAALIGHGVL